MRHSLKLLALGCLVSACGNPKLKITEICFVNAGQGSLDCYDPKGNHSEKSYQAADGYTAFSVENGQRIQAYVTKCEKAGVQP